jgi:hypothetical protein
MSSERGIAAAKRFFRKITPMLGFKRFETAANHDQWHRAYRKHSETSVQNGKIIGHAKTAPEIWAAILAV